jgi:hypothetical protein
MLTLYRLLNPQCVIGSRLTCLQLWRQNRNIMQSDLPGWRLAQQLTAPNVYTTTTPRPSARARKANDEPGF